MKHQTADVGRLAGVCRWAAWRRLLLLVLVLLALCVLLHNTPLITEPLAVTCRGEDTPQDERSHEESTRSPRECPPSASGLYHTLTQHRPADRAGTPPQPHTPLISVTYKRRLASTLVTVQRQIARLAGKHAVVDAKWALTLEALVEELDPRIAAHAKNSTWDYSARLPDKEPSTATHNKTRHVCPEVYYGSSYDRPFHQHGMEPEKCTSVSPLRDVLTAVLPALSWPQPTISFVIFQIRKHYNIPIIVLASERLSADIKLDNVRVEYPKKSNSEAVVLNNIMKLVKTPYVFIGTSLAHFSNQSSLERLVRVLDDLEHVEVAAGAARDLQGRWLHGCLQHHMANYQASYTMGYYYSRYECMYCDDVLTPFVTSAKLVKKVAFSGGLNGPAMFRDWFVKVRKAGHLAMVCPDVMFFLTNHVTMTSKHWLPVARRWTLQKVLSYTGKTFNFTCKNLNINCNNIREISRSFLLPPCCINIAITQLDMVIDVADKNGLEYELQSGSALGAVKFGSYLPWDTDHDIYIECKDFKTWYQKLGPIAKANNCTLKIKYKNIFLKIVCPSLTLDIFCQKNLSRMFLPDEYVHTPTSIWYSGHWVKVVANPGLFCRNFMGFEDLKHVQHSTHLKGSNSTLRPGSWLPCLNPQHHSCLDRFPADGNIPFLVNKQNFPFSLD